MKAKDKTEEEEFFKKLVAEISACPLRYEEDELSEEEKEEALEEEMANRAAICHSQGLWY